MPGVKCPNCGNEVPEEFAQHAAIPVSGLVTCPHCGAEVHLGAGGHDVSEGASGAKAKAATGGEHDSFSGNETIEGLKEELDEKQEGT